MPRAVQHNTLGVRDQAGAEVGAGSILVTAPFGSPGPFDGNVAYSMVEGSQPGRGQVFDTSQRDGGVPTNRQWKCHALEEHGMN
jgi:hypothetical protein